MTNTTGRAELAAIAAALTHNYTHIATDSLSLLTSPTTKANPIPRGAQHHAQGGIMWKISNPASLGYFPDLKDALESHMYAKCRLGYAERAPDQSLGLRSPSKGPQLHPGTIFLPHNFVFVTPIYNANTLHIKRKDRRRQNNYLTGPPCAA
eukprot:1159131-Pelagomonas_calceolata.AAC.1